MSTVNIKINGTPVQAKEGSTVLEASRAAGVDIPTLCHHPALANIGACRICLVEIAKQPALQPACTFPVMEGMEVETESPRAVEIRKFVLEMLFSERNHYCMYCEMSGDCELQALAYRYKLDHWTYPSPQEKYEVDGSRKYFMMDHNRCILCRRCIRACADLAANNTLGLKFRGAKTMINADMDVPFGDSTCVSCGTCLQVCPTGALVDRKSAYMGRNCQVEKTASTCTFCSVGCQTQVVTRGGHPIRVEGDWDGANGGVLCQAGRFDPIYEMAPRITAPLMRKKGKLEEVGMDEALAAIGAKLKAAGGARTRAVITGRALDQTLDAFVGLFRDKLQASIGTLEPSLGMDLPQDGTLASLDGADAILIAGGDPLDGQKVLGYRIKRARQRGAAVLFVGDAKADLARFATKKFAPEQLDKAIALCAAAASPAVVYGDGLTEEAINQLATLKDKARFLPLYPATNGRQAEALGLRYGLSAGDLNVAFVLAQDAPLTEGALKLLRAAKCLIAVASHAGPLTEVADIVLPAALWYERQGTFCNLEGRTMTVTPALKAPEWLVEEDEVLSRLAAKL